MSQIPDVSGTPIPVQVGDKLFHVHEGTLTSTSKFFAGVMKPEWRTDPTKPIDLSDDEPERFEAYCQWLYGRKIAELSGVSNKEAVDEYHLHLAKLYVFGEKILDETFQDVVLALLISSCFARHTYLGEQKFPGNHIIATIYEGTSDAESPARRLLIDIWTYTDTEEWG
jgi:hypothetical protein